MDEKPPFELLRATDDRLAGIEPNSSTGQAALDNTRESVAAAAHEYRHPSYADSRAAFDRIRDAQQSLDRLAAEVDGEDEATVEEASLLLYEASDASARLATRNAYDVVDAYEEEFESPGQRQAAESALGNAAAAALDRADRAASNVRGGDTAGPTDARVKARAKATVHQRNAWKHAEKALDKVENNTAPDISADHGQAFERNGTVLVPVEVVLTDVRPYEYETVEITTSENRSASADLYGPPAPDTYTAGTAFLDVGPDAPNQTATVTATASHDAARTARTTLEIRVDEDGVVPERTPRDEYDEAEVSNEETGVTVDVGGEGVYEDAISIENASSEAAPEHVVGPTVRIENRSRADVDSATVTMPIGQNVDLADREDDLQIFKWDPHTEDAWRPVDTDIDVDNRTASAEVSSFSLFKVADAQQYQDRISDTATPGWPALETFDAGAGGWDTDGDVTVENGQLVVSSDSIDTGGTDPDPETGISVSIEDAPEEANSGESIPVEFEIHNGGDNATSTTVSYSSNDFDCDGEAGEYSLDAGETETGSFSCTAYSSGRAVEISVSADDASDSTLVDIGSADSPDFPVSFTESNPSVQKGSTTSISYEVSNRNPTSETVTVDFSASDLDCESSARHTVGPYGTRSGSVKCSAPDSPGRDTVTASTEDDSDSTTVDINVYGSTFAMLAASAEPADDATEASSARRTVDLSDIDAASYELEYSGSADGENAQATITVRDDRQVYEKINVEDASSTTVRGRASVPSGDLAVEIETEGDAEVRVDYVSVLRDSAGSGIPDTVERMDLHMPAGRTSGLTPLDLDPTTADTSGDGLRDDRVVDIDHGIRETSGSHELYAEVESAIAHPARVDSTGDGLTDREQIEGWEISVVDDHDAAAEMMSALADPDWDPDVAEYFETRTVTADPLLNKTAGRLTDAEERSLGTDPSESDTTSDGISDARALELDEEDPTVFKTSGPRVDVVKFAGGWDDGSVELPDDGFTLPEVDRPGYTYEYHIITDDPTRVSRVTLTHSGRTRLDETYSGKRTVRESGEYHAEAEAALSYFRGANAQVTTEDEHGNERVVSVYSKRSFAGTAASNLPMQQEELGQLSGFTYGAAELPDFVRIILTEPRKVGRNLAELYAEYIEAKQGGVRSKNEFWIKMAKGMAESTYQDQADDNPHALPAEAENPREALDICVDQYVDQSQSDYCEFATGWYKGYSMFMILETVVGSKGISKASKFDDIKPDLEAGLRQIDDSHRLVRGEVLDTKTGKISQRLMADGGTPDIDAPAVRQGLNDRGITTAGGQKRALDRLERIDHLDTLSSSQQTALGARLVKVADPDATVRFVNELDDTSDILHLLDEDAATTNQLVKWHANPEAYDLIDPKVSASDFVYVARNSDVSETRLVVKGADESGTPQVRWLEDGNIDEGWTHIKSRHIKGEHKIDDEVTSIFPAGSRVKGEKMDDTISEEDIVNMIYDSIKDGTPSPQGQKTKYYFEPEDSGYPDSGIDDMQAIVKPDGSVETTFPISGEAVVRWIPDIDEFRETV